MQMLVKRGFTGDVRHLSDKNDAQYSEKLKDGKVLLTTRNGIFQVRLYTGDRRYIYKSLRTRDVDEARERAIRAYYELEFRKEQDLPTHKKRFSDVINEYLRMREAQHLRGNYVRGKKAKGQQTSPHMLRQMKRVSKFWHEYCGNKEVEKINDALLRDYVEWRRDYYKRMPKDKIPRNAKINPADKTLEWETTFALTLLKYAQERGYRGNLPTPKFRHKGDRNQTRPPFTPDEYRRLYVGMRRWIRETNNERWRYTRELLRDYVLFLANSGLRVGEANSLRVGDLSKFKDENDRELYGFEVDGKTGKRFVVIRTNANSYVDRTLERNARWQPEWQRLADERGEKMNDYLFKMVDGTKIITLIDQFNVLLEREGLTYSADGEKYSLYSLRHFYAVHMLRKGRANVFDIARNMGTSVQIIENYYGKQATSRDLAGRLAT
jgi:integrase